MLPELVYLCTGRQTYQVDLLMYCFHASLPDSLPPPVCFSPPKKTQCLSVTFNCAGNTGNELNNRIEEINTMREITKLIYFTFYQTLNQEQLRTSSVFDITVIAIILKKVYSFIITYNIDFEKSNQHGIFFCINRHTKRSSDFCTICGNVDIHNAAI